MAQKKVKFTVALYLPPKATPADARRYIKDAVRNYADTFIVYEGGRIDSLNKAGVSVSPAQK